MNTAARRLTICLSLALAAHVGLFAAVADVDLTPTAARDRTLAVTFSTRLTQQTVTSRVIARGAQIGGDERSQPRRERQTAPLKTLAGGAMSAGDVTPKRVQREANTPTRRLTTSGQAQPQSAQTGNETAQSQLTRSARQDSRAAYLVAWRQRVERYGNRHYPSGLIAQAPRHRLTLGVTLRADGSLYTVRVLKSSGSTALDRAAQQIVRNAGPFAPLPAAVRAQQPSLTFAYDWIFDSAS